MVLCSFAMLAGCKKFLPEDCQPEEYLYICKYKQEYQNNDSVRLCYYNDKGGGSCEYFVFNKDYGIKKQIDGWISFSYEECEVNDFYLTKYISDKDLLDYRICLKNRIDDYPFTEVYQDIESTCHSLSAIDSLIKNDLLMENCKKLR